MAHEVNESISQVDGSMLPELPREMAVNPHSSNLPCHDLSSHESSSPIAPSDSQSATTSSIQFSRLPSEIQLMIWQYALPDPRNVYDVYLVIVNFNLENPRAIVPSPKEYNKIHHLIWNGVDLPQAPRNWWEPIILDVLSLLHTCRDSRFVAGGIYCLDIKSDTWNKNLWDPETDMVCFIDGGMWRHQRLHWLCQKREQPHPSLASTKHIALRLDALLMDAMNLTPPIRNPRSPPKIWDFCWLENLPSVQSFDLCFDPGDVSDKKEGSVVGYEPLNIPVRYLSRFLPSKIQEEFSKKLEDSAKKLDMEPPVVELSVLCWKEPRK